MITPNELRRTTLLQRVPEHELESIAESAADIELNPGDWLISEGETPSFYGCISGRLSIYKGTGRDQHLVGEFAEGDTFGEVPLLLDTPAVASVRARDQARVFRLDPTDFRSLILSCPVLSEQVIRSMNERVANLRRDALETERYTVTIIGPRWDPECHDLRDFLLRNHVAFDWFDPHDALAAERIPAAMREDPRFPILVLPDGGALSCPSLRAVANAVGLCTKPAQDRYDLAIVGAGPAGLAAAVYGASEGLRTVLIECSAPGGQAGTSSRIENYLGFPTGLSGDDLAKRALQQAMRFGVDVVVARKVAGIAAGGFGEAHAVELDSDGDRVEASAIVLATGVTWRKLNAPGLNELNGRGVYYGAARTEALAARGKHVHLVGGGNSAGQGAMFFSNYAAHVTILVRGSGLADTMSHYLIDQLATKANISIEPHSEIVRAIGEDHLAALEIRDPRTDARRTVDADALFIFIGADAETGWLPDEIICDERGFVCTGRDVIDLIEQRHAARPWPDERDPYLLETSVPGIFAVGDVRHGSIKRVASGVGEGSMSVAFVHQYLASQAKNLPIAAVT